MQLTVKVSGQDPESVAAGIVEAMRTTDPRTVAAMIGGGRSDAEKLGLVYREPTGW